MQEWEVYFTHILLAAILDLMFDATDFMDNFGIFVPDLLPNILSTELWSLNWKEAAEARMEDALKLKSRPNLNTLFTILAICSSAVQQLLFKANIPAIIE